MWILSAGDQGDKGDRGPTERGPKGAPGAPGLPGTWRCMKETFRSFYHRVHHFSRIYGSFIWSPQWAVWAVIQILKTAHQEFCSSPRWTWSAGLRKRRPRRREGTSWRSWCVRCSRTSRPSWPERLLWVVTVHPAHGGIASFCEGHQHEGPHRDVRRGGAENWETGGKLHSSFIHLGFVTFLKFGSFTWKFCCLEANFVVLKRHGGGNWTAHTFWKSSVKKLNFTSVLPSLYCKMSEMKNSRKK